MARILAISHDASLYGAQRSLADAALGLTDLGHEVEVCVPESGPLVDVLRAHGIRVHLVGYDRWIPAAPRCARWRSFLSLLRSPLALYRACRLLGAGRYDVVYTNTVTVLNFALAAAIRRVPHVWHLREAVAGNPQLRSPLSNARVLALVQALSARVIYNSRYLQACYGAKPSVKDVVVHNGLRPWSDGAVRSARDANGRFVILTAGFMNRRKGLDVLLDALALLPADLRSRVTLRVAGPIEEDQRRREIEPRLRRLDAAVELLGWVDGLGGLLAGADLLVSSARDEPFGRTLVEAMLAGLPVLATRSGGPEEIVADGVTGVLVPKEDPQALSDGLARLMRNPRQLESYGRAGRERALAQFSLATCARGIEQCLLEAVSGSRASTAVHRP